MQEDLNKTSDQYRNWPSAIATAESAFGNTRAPLWLELAELA